MEKNKPIEYWISRSTDPYLDEHTRKSNIECLCDRVNGELEGAQIATNILSHKVVSPDQDEALFALQVVDQLVRRCGEKVHIKVGKFRFLNQIVKLITPKYLGTQTSAEVKELAIRLLYTWQKSIKHVEKFKEVYDNLKEHKIILEDPEIPEEQLVTTQAHGPKLAEFEDEQKSRMLKELLRSGKPEDLQAANRLIKSLVRNNEHKTEKEHVRRQDLERATKLCEQLKLCMVEKTAEAIGIASESVPGEKIVKTFDELMNLRPTLFRHAGEAAESSDQEILTEILQVNDQVNKWIQKYRQFAEKMPIRRSSGGSKEECADLLGTSSDILEAESPLTPVSIPSQPVNDPFECLESSTTSDITQDVPFIGFDRNMTPALPRRACKSRPVENNPISISNLIDGDLIGKEKISASSFTPAKPTLNDLCSTSENHTGFASIDTLIPETRVSPLTNVAPPLEATSLTLRPEPPTVVLDNMNIRVLAYRAVQDTSQKEQCFLLVVLNMNAEDVTNMRLTIISNTSNVQLRTEEKGPCAMRAVSDHCPISTEHHKLGITPLTPISEVELDISIRFTLHFERTVTSGFTLRLS